MEKLSLIVPSMEYDKEISSFRDEFVERKEFIQGALSLTRLESTKEWIEQIEKVSNKDTFGTVYVPIKQFIYVRENDKKVLGCIQVRLGFNEYFSEYAGHIGYSVCPSERNKSYASKMLAECLVYCKKIGFKEVLISCLETNIASKKVILNNAGEYIDTVLEDKNGVYLSRYRIELA